MSIIFITGMSGTGKSSVIRSLLTKGFHAIDTDYDDWKKFSEPDHEWIMDEEKILPLLLNPQGNAVFLSACCSNQQKFYTFFDQVVLLSAPLNVILERVLTRSNNCYGKSPTELAEIIANFEEIQPKLQTVATLEIDTSKNNVEQICRILINLII